MKQVANQKKKTKQKNREVHFIIKHRGMQWTENNGLHKTLYCQGNTCD